MQTDGYSKYGGNEMPVVYDKIITFNLKLLYEKWASNLYIVAMPGHFLFIISSLIKKYIYNISSLK